MNTGQQLAKHFHDVYFGGNWTAVNLKEVLADVSWQEAVQRISELNTIAVLVYHINWYVVTIQKVLEGGALEGNDKMSFDGPPVTNAEDWQQLRNNFFSNAMALVADVERLEDACLSEDFDQAKYGNYFRNILGLIEHTHYHLGQISVIKKLLRTF